MLNGRSLILNGLKRWIRQRFPSIQSITTGDVARRLGNPSQPQPLILDVRTPEEYAVSHLESAQLMPDVTEFTIKQRLENYGKDTPIVVYCSIGYRSARVAQRLKEAGFRSVFNLEGGIFQWANEGRSLFQDEEPVQKVHPYNAVWGQLLNPCHRQSVPMRSIHEPKIF